jgi:tetratricopeptide (TPR) repeat protein
VTLRVFCSYSAGDEAALDELQQHLSPMSQEKVIELWDDRKIKAGEERQTAIDAQLAGARIILLLVSADFVADPECQRETTRALERASRGEATVVPVLLRRLDWERLPMARYRALPTNGRPVESWPRRDEAWQNVATGLRKLLEPVAPPKPDGTPSKPSRPSLPRWKIAVGVVPLVIALGVFGTWRTYRAALREGDRYLNIGRGHEAEAAFKRALRLVPVGSQAQSGLEKAHLWNDDGMDAVAFERSVRELQLRDSDDPYVKVLAARIAYARGDYARAIPLFESAVRQAAELAEAHAGLGSCYEQVGKLEDAARSYQRAAQISDVTPRYVGNLAWVHALQGKIDQAIGELRGIVSDYPLGSVELGKLLWARGAYSSARDEQKKALAALAKPEVGNAVENQGRWSFAARTPEGEAVGEIDGSPQKACYVRLDLSVSLFLAGREPEARSAIAAVVRDCPNQVPELVSMLAADLDWAKPSAEPGAIAGYAKLLAEVTGDAQERLVLLPQ